MEPILDPKNNRLTVYPIKYTDIWRAYKKQIAAFWTTEEIDFSKDYDDFIKLNENEQYFIKMILSFFAASDTIVNINLGERFIQEVQIREAIIAYDFQKMMENIHNETYSLQIDNIIRNNEEKEKALNDFVLQSAKYTLAMFKACGLKTHIECMIIDDETKEEYEYLKEKYLDDKTLEEKNNNIFLELTQKMQHVYCCTPNKFEVLEEHFKKWPQEKHIIFCKFIRSQEEVKAAFPKAQVLSYQKESMSLN